jgi:membrane carboxypeptidase/penicillin-binding protein
MTSRKKKNSTKKKISPKKKVSAKKSTLKKISKKRSTKKKEPDFPEIIMSNKIILPKSKHSYRTVFFRKFSRYINIIKKPVISLVRLLIMIAVFCSILFAIIFVVYGRGLPNVAELKEKTFSETTVIYDRDGNVLYSVFGEENRKYVPLKYINKYAIESTLSIEDKNFYSHPGFDVGSIIRAQLRNIEEEKIAQGASTITQQLAKNLYLSPEKTYQRKIKEILLALQIEWYFSKDEILEMYLNKIPYGSNAFGIEAAAQTFFGKSSKDLTLAESSILASLPKAPTFYSPYGQNRDLLMGYCMSAESKMVKEDVIEEEPTEEVLPETAVEESVEEEVIECGSPYDPNYIWGRKDQVLKRMIEDDYITEEEMLAAWEEAKDIIFKDPVYKIEAPHFVFYVKELLEEKYGKEFVQSGGLEIYTTLDPKLQSIAEEAVAAYATINKGRYGADNAGLVALDPKTGQVLAMVGSVDYWNSEIDGQVNTTTSLRQPGSSFKPIVYGAAMQNAGLGSGSKLSDEKTLFNRRDVPRNSDGDYQGDMNVRAAIARSRNIPAIKAYFIAGEEEKILELTDLLGIKSLREFRDTFNADAEERGWTFYYGWPMAIGSGEVRLIDLVGAYSVFANGGKRIEISPILEIRKRNGEILESRRDFSVSPEPPAGYAPSETEAYRDENQILDPQVAFIINDILSDSYARPGGSWRATLTIPGQDAAAKTGTSNKKVGRASYANNTLTIGYTPSIAAGVWVGNTDGSRLWGSAWGLTAAAPIWKKFMEETLKDKPLEEFPEPPGIRWYGKEAYPSYAPLKNFDLGFAKVEDEEEEEVPEADWITATPDDASGAAKPAPAPPVSDIPPPTF